VKVLVCHPGPDFSVQDVHDGICAGLAANGVEVRSFNFNDRLCFYSSAHVPVDGELVKAMPPEAAKWLANRWLEAETFRWWPDVIVFVSAFMVDKRILELFRHRPQHTVAWMTEATYEDAEQIAMAGLFDTVIVNDPDRRFAGFTAYLLKLTGKQDEDRRRRLDVQPHHCQQ
jgi:hypothetical protein